MSVASSAHPRDDVIADARARRSRSQRAAKENPCFHPVALNGANSQTKRLRRLRLGQPPEEAAVDDARESRIPGRELIERLVELEDQRRLIIDGDRFFIERHRLSATASL